MKKPKQKSNKDTAIGVFPAIFLMLGLFIHAFVSSIKSWLWQIIFFIIGMIIYTFLLKLFNNEVNGIIK